MNLNCVIPQDLSITASPTFAGLTLSGITDRRVLFSDSGVLTGDADFTFVESQTVATATNATPIVIGIVGHGRQNGDLVCISGAVGNTAANGTWVVANQAADTFELAGTVGNGAYTPDSATADMNVEVSGCASVQHLRIAGTTNSHIGVNSLTNLYFQTLNGGTANFDLLSSLGTGEVTQYAVYGVHGGPDDVWAAGFHAMSMGWKPGRYQIATSGTAMPIEIFTPGFRHQFELNIDGSINMDKGPVNITGGDLNITGGGNLNITLGSLISTSADASTTFGGEVQTTTGSAHFEFTCNSTGGEDYFQFNDDIVMLATEKILFRNSSAPAIWSGANNQLDITSTTRLNITSNLVNVAGAITASSTITGLNGVFTGTFDITGVTTLREDVIFVGTGSGLAYGGIYNQNVNTPLGLTVAGKVNKLQVPFAADEAANNCTPRNATDDILIDVAGVYLVNCSINIDSQAGGAGEYEFSLWKLNGATEFPNSNVKRDLLAGAGGAHGSMSLNCILTLAVSDTLELWAWNNTTTGDCNVDNCTLSIVQIGG